MDTLFCCVTAGLYDSAAFSRVAKFRIDGLSQLYETSQQSTKRLLVLPSQDNQILRAELVRYQSAGTPPPVAAPGESAVLTAPVYRPKYASPALNSLPLESNDQEHPYTHKSQFIQFPDLTLSQFSQRQQRHFNLFKLPFLFLACLEFLALPRPCESSPGALSSVAQHTVTGLKSFKCTSVGSYFSWQRKRLRSRCREKQYI